MKIEIKSHSGKILFSLERRGNSMLKTLEKAVSEGVYLGFADLQRQYLYMANLTGADLQSSYLVGADLKYANLRGARLFSADLTGANLGGADLRDTDIRHVSFYGTDLRRAKLEGADLGYGKIKKIAVFSGLYYYTIIPYVTQDNEFRIMIRTKDKLLSEWENKFRRYKTMRPDDANDNVEDKIFAFRTAKGWFKRFAK